MQDLTFYNLYISYVTYESNENLQGAYQSTGERHAQSFCRHPNKSASMA